MPNFHEQLKSVYAEDRKAWRKWLRANHKTSGGIWLIYYKKGSGKPSISYAEAVKEALCFGWIDSKVNPIDGERYKQVFTPRKPKSVWSALNKRYITELLEQKQITRAGLKAIETAKQNGMWASLDAVESLTIPKDLEKAFAANQPAYKNFEAFTRGVRKQFLYRLNSAKRQETRAKRIAEIIAAAAKPIT
ncbi:MAG: YdeI/OmpD-associated family protein [Rhizobacter sp.]|nr:YdeI/OmpD-associated family protein [Chlorobiales bacterium]